ncbi:MAG: alpha/beta fold hydrolase [Burkholderiales bacterium]
MDLESLTLHNAIGHGRQAGVHPGHNRQAVLLLHGLCANPLEMQPLARMLHQAGYSVHSPLIEGMGVDSLALRQGWRPGVCEQWVDEAVRHFDALAATHERVAVAGLCIGAVLALALAARRTPQALVLLSPTLYFDGWNVSPWRRLLPLAYLPGLRQWLSFAERPPYGLKNERLRKWIAQAMASDGLCAVGAARLPAASLYQAERLIREARRELADITVPALVLHATEDDVASPRSVHLLSDRLGRTPEVTWFDDSYHMLTLDNEREAVCSRVASFVAEHLPGIDHSIRTDMEVAA